MPGDLNEFLVLQIRHFILIDVVSLEADQVFGILVIVAGVLAPIRSFPGGIKNISVGLNCS